MRLSSFVVGISCNWQVVHLSDHMPHLRSEGYGAFATTSSCTSSSGECQVEVHGSRIISVGGSKRVRSVFIVRRRQNARLLTWSRLGLHCIMSFVSWRFCWKAYEKHAGLALVVHHTGDNALGHRWCIEPHFGRASQHALGYDFTEAVPHTSSLFWRHAHLYTLFKLWKLFPSTSTFSKCVVPIVGNACASNVAPSCASIPFVYIMQLPLE